MKVQLTGERPEGQEENLKLKWALAEIERLREENVRLKARLGLGDGEHSVRAYSEPDDETVQSASGNLAAITASSSAADKIALFRSLFRGRDDVYALRWENRTGEKSGYAPACRNERDRGLCRKPAVKCAHCPHHDLLPFTDAVIHDHLSGKHTVGIYPLLKDDTCWFLAMDLDSEEWADNAGVLLDVCDESGVPAVLERSRSGNGGHVWVFFDRPVAAAAARRLGSMLLSASMERSYHSTLDAFDRLFPSQDTLPRGGFGNLIALPLQKKPRDLGNSIFVDRALRRYPDQWAFLSTVKRLGPAGLDIAFERLAGAEEEASVGARSLSTPADRKGQARLASGERGRPNLPPEIVLTYRNMLTIPKAGLPPSLLTDLRKLASFPNPEFYKAQAMRLSTYGKPRIINCADDRRNELALPRGCLEDAGELLAARGVKVEVQDRRSNGTAIDVTFRGELRPAQLKAVEALLAHDNGVLSATTGFGKTVVAAWLIAARKVNTLVLVHRRQLLEQWRERLGSFLGLPVGAVGRIGAGKHDPTGVVDVALIQSLGRKGAVDGVVSGYGQVIVDECHHLPAFSFERVLKNAEARYVVGLTATPIRKDGHQPIITMQCGPIRYKAGAREQAASAAFQHVVIPRHTGMTIVEAAADVTADTAIQATPATQATQSGETAATASIQELYSLLAHDRTRNALIVQDIVDAVREGRCPLVLTERTEHLNELAAHLEGKVGNLLILHGRMSARQRTEVMDRLRSVGPGEERVLLATGRYIGEGFDDARLDTLFLTLPISWRGTLQQYAGRLHRAYDQKLEVRIYDYVDSSIPMLLRMYRRRLTGYAGIGYEVREGQPAPNDP